MRIRLEHKSSAFEYERRPMPGDRFRALCSLALAAIAGGVFLGAIARVGVWAIGAALAAFVMYGIYQIFQSI